MLVSTACSSGTYLTPYAYTDTATTTSSVPTTSTPTNLVTVAGLAFTPNSITVSVGATVNWANMDGVDHTVTCNNGPSTFDRYITAGTIISITFSVRGTYNYFCLLHPVETGIVIVI